MLAKLMLPLSLIAIEVYFYFYSKTIFTFFLPFVAVGIVSFIYFQNNPVKHGRKFRIRSYLNWLPLGLTYACLYMGRYNLTEAKKKFGDALMPKKDFGTIFGVGAVVYGVSFLVNGPLTDRLGGKRTMLIGASGSALANLLLGYFTHNVMTAADAATSLFWPFLIIYAVNMYFQSFGAVSIVKVNAPWFHVRERGVFGAIFGILISLGVYFAFDWSKFILDGFATELDSHAGLPWVFFIPTLILAAFWVADFLMVKDTPGLAGLEDFHTGDATAGDDSPRLPVIEVFKLMLRNPIIMTIALVEFCSGFLRQAIMQWYRTFANQTDAILGLKGTFVYENWGMLLCVAGISGGVIAGILSDHVFGSRRGPVAFLLYGVMLIGAVVLTFAYQSSIVGPLVVIMSMAIIGVHGMLSGTASMDFGGRKNAGTAVGLIDGFVYLGTGVMAVTYGLILPEEKVDKVTDEFIGPCTDPANWTLWPIAMIPLALIGLVLAVRIWHAFPQPAKKKG